MAAKSYAHITNDFLHDLSTGVWAACVLVIWLLAGRVEGAPADAALALADAQSMLLWLAVAALLLIGMTGGVRLRYWRADSDAATLAEKRRALLVKHAAFAVVYGAGTLWAYTLI